MGRTKEKNSVQTIVNCKNLDEMLRFFVGALGFRLEMIAPADAPTIAIVSGFGTTLRLEESEISSVVTLRLAGEFPDSDEFVIPGELNLVFAETDGGLEIPKSTNEFVVTIAGDSQNWHEGRAGMLYRDLIPGRLGGRFIASHIRIPVGGPVPDYVHYHKIRFQMIYCLAGWARLVYEDQGQPFLMNAGDCVLQPPEIRHRVLECSDGFEVLEIGCPAVHETFAEYALELPNAEFDPKRDFGGQCFDHSRASEMAWQASNFQGVKTRRTAILEATDGLADVETLSAESDVALQIRHSDEFYFMFIEVGQMALAEHDGTTHQFGAGSSFVLAPNLNYQVSLHEGLKAVRVRLRGLTK